MAYAAGAEFLSRFIWETTNANHGGFSGLELGADGTSFVAITDRGYVAQGTLRRTNGEITGVETQRFHRLRAKNGAPLAARLRGDSNSFQDAEGLAQAADGTLYVSFEGVHRVWRYASVDATAQNIPPHPDFANLQGNSGLEALAIDAHGALYTLPERSGQLSQPFPLYRFTNGAWSIPYVLPRRGEYLPVGADFGPDGKLYLLERQFSGLLGFSSRVRRFSLGPKGAIGEEQVLVTPNLRHGNLEGLSVWRDGAGHIRLTMIEDDNFSIFQHTQFVEYRVSE